MAFEIMHPRAAGGGNRGQRFMKKVHDLIEKIPPMEQLRSEEMSLVQLIIPSESAHRTVTYLGDLGLLQFKDLNSDKSPFQRTYAAQVKRCNEISRKLGFFKDQLDKVGIPIPSDSMEQGINFEYLENQLADYESELQEIIVNGEKLQHSYNELSEFKLVLQKVGTFLSTSQSNGRASEIQLEENSNAEEDLADTSSLLQKEPTEVSIKGRLGYICGLVPKAKVIQFERILFRATRGNILFKQAAVEQVNDPIMCEMVEKVVFVVLFAGDHAKQKILKICDAFGANRYPFPEDSERQRTIKAEVTGRLADYQSTIDAGLRHRNDVLSTISYNYEMWNSTVLKEKAIYHTLNKLNVDVMKKCLIGEAWCPSSAKVQIQDALHRAALDSRSQMSTIFHPLHSAEAPPTYFKTNKFNVAFQEIVDAYGVAKYQEANPAVYMIITFPFLFAVMFGDWGHGLCLLILTLVLILREKQLARQKLGDIMQIAFAGRYVLLLMALFSIYCGLIYNEFFSVPFYIFGPSAYKCRDLSCSDATKVGLIKYRSPYPFGVDPKWRGSRTELPFLNSLKMKMSILLGVSQMNLGVILSYCNAKFFRNPLNIRYQFIPQMIFLNSLFGYLALLIIIKWCSGSKADLYHVMIYMFLSPTDDLGENQLFWGQKVFQILLVLLAVIAVPWMLFPKPFLLRKQHRQRFEGRAYGILGSSDTESVDTEHDYSPVHEEFNFSEIFVHQMIHTIEFVLGAVSNTASYLRLWALSLAHSELSAVFYEKVLQPSWRSDSAIVKLIGFVVFAFATTMVLLVMETLSAFLHALRLHWVEFQNKFYEGDGYKFQPFSFTTIHEETD